MAGPLRIFISHSSDDAVLAQALSERIAQQRGPQVLLDTSGLEAGQAWRRQLHEWLARCGAGVVLLTPAVLARPEWVLKEAIILGWRLDLERAFSLYFVLAPGVTLTDFESAGFHLAQLAATQILPGNLAEIAQVDALATELIAHLPATQPATQFDELQGELKKLMGVADPGGATYPDIAAHLGIAAPATWGPDKIDQLAELITREIVNGRDSGFAMDQLIVHVRAWSQESRFKLINLLVPFWIDAEMAGALLRRAPSRPVPPPPIPPGPGALTIAGTKVHEFTAEMVVRRAFGTQIGNYLLADPVVGLGGDLFDDIRSEICDFARRSRLTPSPRMKDDQVVEALRSSHAPMFAPLSILPDDATINRLRAEFPRVVFLAPRPLGRAAPTGDELKPDPCTTREQTEHLGWELARNSIRNG